MTLSLAQLIALLRHPDLEVRDLSSLRRGYYGAAIMPVEVLAELSRRLPEVQLFNFYGQTEMSALALCLAPEDQVRKAGSAGRPAFNVETRLVGPSGDPVPAGSPGEILHRSPQATRGYWNDEAKTAEAFRDGWFHSGDIGVADEDGYITVVSLRRAAPAVDRNRGRHGRARPGRGRHGRRIAAVLP